jgi:F-type H+-transporting ATPase subunit alpha
MGADTGALDNVLKDTFTRLKSSLDGYQPEIAAEEVGTITFVGSGIVLVKGLSGVRSEEIVRFPGDLYGLVFNVDANDSGIIMLDSTETLKAGDEVKRTGRVLDVPVGDAFLGRVVDSIGRPLDGLGEVHSSERMPVERLAPPIMHRDPVTVPLQTGLKAIDALIPIGRGQRELILGDRQTGKTAIALDTVINQRNTGVICIYCAVGKQGADVARTVAVLKEYGAISYSIIVVASGEDAAGLQYVAPYAATSMAEYFMSKGKDVLIIYDDLTSHARAYRELSLLLRRPPGREAYPGDIFYIHSRLLERSTHLRKEYGGGSLTALPIIETEAGDISSYIPTNLISITDGQLYLSTGLYQKGVLPAIDVGKSVSRVGGKAQLPAYRAVAGDLRISYSQFEELESFSRFGTRLDEATKRTLERGWRVREVLKQPQFKPIPVAEQITAMLAVTNGAFDNISTSDVCEAENALRKNVKENQGSICSQIESGNKLTDENRKVLLDEAVRASAQFSEITEDGNS